MPGSCAMRIWDRSGKGPPFDDQGVASYYLGLNRNKRLMHLDLQTNEGRERMLALLADADVLLENFKVGTLERWGLGYEELAQRFPGLIHCRVSGFGADGPLGALPGYDAALQAMCGLMSVNGLPDGDPLRVGMPVVDMVTGLNATIGILLALHERKRSGRGQFVEATLFDSGLSLLHPHAANWFLNGRLPVRTGNAHPNIYPYDTLHTATGPVFFAVGNDRQFGMLVRHLGAPDMATDARFATAGARSTNRVELKAQLEALLADRDGTALAEELMRLGVPCAAVLDVAQALQHPRTAHRSMIVSMGRYRGLGSPVRLSRTPATLRYAPLTEGQAFLDLPAANDAG